MLKQQEKYGYLWVVSTACLKFTHLIKLYKNRYTKAYNMKYMHCS
jgi:hypothetical protein